MREGWRSNAGSSHSNRPACPEQPPPAIFSTRPTLDDGSCADSPARTSKPKAASFGFVHKACPCRSRMPMSASPCFCTPAERYPQRLRRRFNHRTPHKTARYSGTTGPHSRGWRQNHDQPPHGLTKLHDRSQAHESTTKPRSDTLTHADSEATVERMPEGQCQRTEQWQTSAGRTHRRW